ncbi:MAG: U32 family peptidase [Oscillospiraceae bacterium]|nr:U32 family peptidase [Oscillospiraceae bacterium]
MVELLSPAGSREALVAAVQSGADAVYLGMDDFNARRGARNFSEEEFARAVSYCHLRGVRVYLTLNTLLTDRELPAAADALRRANASGVDAVLVQDWGLLTLAREIVPELPLHASTQMSIFTLSGARFAAKLGLDRVVLARELRREDIAAICRDCGAEVEVFVHGALCMCYSGQCAMSALIGRRSGNRGACAQPCRLPYGVNAPAGSERPLSLKDNNLSAYLQELDAMGVACLKIEGRMKRPEYVAVVTSIYRRLLDERRAPTAEESARLSAAFDRDGFTDGYYRGKLGDAMLGARPENARWPEDLFAAVRKNYETAEHRTVPVSLHCTVHAGKRAELTASVERDGVSHTVTVFGGVPENARTRDLTESDLCARLRKTGGTVFVPNQISAELDEGLMLSASAINALRREALEEMEQKLSHIGSTRHEATERPLPPCPDAPDMMPLLTCSIARAQQLTNALADQMEAVYIPLELLHTIDLSAFARRTRLFALLPRVFRTADEKPFRAALENTPYLSGAVVGNAGHLPLLSQLPLEVRGDFGLNVYNSRALLFLRDQGLHSATVSFELRHQQIRDLQKYLPCEAIVYGRLPLMIMENCPLRSAKQCSGGKGGVLNDRTGTAFPTLCAYGCRCEIENSRTLFLADKGEYKTCGLTYARLRFTTETPEECLAAARRYNGQSDWTPEEYTRGLFYRGVE